ncbi:tetratricopeptide repeat protein (plasmid) [Streptomyces sp. NBC_01208]|uniref:tetratricopeptide repeat protein n=1 Tax=Streptomyces sp. NBC_01208 TaxID=2903773 RepID=UPI002E14795E|nr:tetratricopeptide repeat protein [Streptomyces sp. NBC_01208]
MRDATFRTALTEHGSEAGMMLEPVEWQHLAEAAGSAAPRTGSPAALLRARRQAAPFRGRTNVLEDLHAFIREAGFGARLLHGPGGQGKTRLAQHFADALIAEGWTVLWLRTDTAVDTLATLSAAATPLLLVVVDYAETRIPQLTALFDAAARHGGGSAFKLLLLARTVGDWWRVLQAATPIAEDLLDAAETIALPPLEPEPGTSRAQAYREAAHGYARHLPQVRGYEHHDWLALAARLSTHRADLAQPDSTLDGPGMETALTLHMTVLADLLDAAGQSPIASSHPNSPGIRTPATSSQGVEDRMLVHERRYWTNTAAASGLHPALTLETLSDALCAAFLLGAATRSEADALLQRVPGLADQPSDRRGAVRGWIASLYPSASATSPWGSLQPDRLAERFIGRHLSTGNFGLVDHLVSGATNAQATQLLTVYARAAAHSVFRHQLDQSLTALCVRHSAVLALPAIDVVTQTETPQPLLDALQDITESPGIPLSDLRRLVDRLPGLSHNLGPWAAHVTRLIATRAQGDPGYTHLRAASLSDLSVRLSALGRREEALVAVSEAVDIRRKLVEVHGDMYLPEHASSLNNLSARLSALGRREEAMVAVSEAVDIRRKLVDVHGDIYLPGLAAALNNLSSALAALGGRREEALVAVSEAVDIRRKLVDVHGDIYLPELASSLSNLSVDLGVLGRREEALTAVSEAVNIRRELVRENRDAYLPHLAINLFNLSARLGALGRWKEALTAAREVVEFYREVVQERRDTYLENFGGALHNLATCLREVGRREEAVTAIREAVEMRRELTRMMPDAHRGQLEESLALLSRLEIDEKDGSGSAS